MSVSTRYEVVYCVGLVPSHEIRESFSTYKNAMKRWVELRGKWAYVSVKEVRGSRLSLKNTKEPKP